MAMVPAAPDGGSTCHEPRTSHRSRSAGYEPKVVSISNWLRDRAGSRRHDPRGWDCRGGMGRESSSIRQACEDARGNAARAHDASDAAILEAAWGQSHLRLSARPGLKRGLDLRRPEANA